MIRLNEWAHWFGALSILCVSAVSPAAAQPQTMAVQVMDIFDDALVHACPEKHLEYLSAGDPSDILAFDFGTSLSRAS